MRICDICRREIETYLSNPCPNCVSTVERLAGYVESADDLDWAALKAAVLRSMAQHEQEIHDALGRRIIEADCETQRLRKKRMALERQDLKCAP